ncbi:HNH endonuclease signature motif containing protein [Kribbella sp. NBC_00359]|uniref:HNH endonuclease signature motif containing protein n=1 Tax=Kribbella sp. NBC_00359 TaxID=2975966 RepID=UPI002E24A7AB
MELLDERPVWSMSGAEMLAGLDQLQADLTRRQVRRLELLAALDANGHAKDIGAGDTVRLLSVRHRLDPRDVRRDLRLATALPRYPTVSAALTNGTYSTDVSQPPTDVPLNPAQAHAIVSALEKVPVTAMVPIEDLQVAEEQMVKAARFLSSGELHKLGVEVRKRLDTDGPEPTDDQARDREDLWLKKADHGVTFGGYLAGENAELLQTLIFAGAKPHKTPDGHRDPRLRGKRQADALTAILHNAAGTGTAVPGHGDIKPHITVTIALDDLRSGTGTGDLIHGDTLPASAVRRLACDAGVIPLVLGSNSEPLDVGTEHRFVTKALRHALNARDKGCIICGAPPAMCEAHHIVHWADGGTTSLDNLTLLCKRDHTAVHKSHWPIHLTNGHPHPTHPTWATPTPPPHQPPQPPPPQPPPPTKPTTPGVTPARPKPSSPPTTPPPNPPRETPTTPIPTYLTPITIPHHPPALANKRNPQPASNRPPPRPPN